jgi:hypothetical protein
VVLEEIQEDKEVHKAKARALGSVSYESEELNSELVAPPL